MCRYDGVIFMPHEGGKKKKPDFGLLMKLADRVKAAEKKHPAFSDGIYQGVGVIGEEYGELCQALNKGQGEERVMDEALDLLCVAWRFCRMDWKKKGE